jgi:hypothetical protein
VRARERCGFVLLLVLAGACPAQAQQKEPLTITAVDGFVELGVRSRQETRSSRGVEVPYSDELKFEERLHLDLGTASPATCSCSRRRCRAETTS